MRRAVEEHEANRQRVLQHVCTATAAQVARESEGSSSGLSHEPAAAVLSASEMLAQAEHECALARERADALREAMAQLAQAAQMVQ